MSVELRRLLATCLVAALFVSAGCGGVRRGRIDEKTDEEGVVIQRVIRDMRLMLQTGARVEIAFSTLASPDGCATPNVTLQTSEFGEVGGFFTDAQSITFLADGSELTSPPLEVFVWQDESLMQEDAAAVVDMDTLHELAAADVAGFRVHSQDVLFTTRQQELLREYVESLVCDLPVAEQTPAHD